MPSRGLSSGSGRGAASPRGGARRLRALADAGIHEGPVGRASAHDPRLLRLPARALRGPIIRRPGRPTSPRETARLTGAAPDDAWGLDHASWAVLRHMFPDADVPVFELSLDMAAAAVGPRGAREAPRVRCATGGCSSWGAATWCTTWRRCSWSDGAAPYDWALEFDDWVAGRIARARRRRAGGATWTSGGRRRGRVPDVRPLPAGALHGGDGRSPTSR